MESEEPCVIETIVENVLCEAGSTTDVAKKQEEVTSGEKKVNYTVVEESTADALPQIMLDEQNATVVQDAFEENVNESVNIMEVETVTVVDVASCAESITSETAQITIAEALPEQQPSTSEDDAVKKIAIDAILAKLSDPEAKLNRRERRALQRELELAQGIQRDFTAHIPGNDSSAFTNNPHEATSSCNAASVGCFEFLSIIPGRFGALKIAHDFHQKWPVREHTAKRPATTSDGNQGVEPKIRKTQV
ncbi:unnamed protein product [Strongylus vulgaris]|uniref:Uncharacterized protein n=1 Tax=Strongylus vulgaris TaxID=40348 RepID=A0A3P7JAI5_STRVU|nr:unnamed protein product [Strongylus vulgaris]